MKKVQPKKEVKQPTAENFTKEYQQLCDKMGYRIVVSPVWVARDDGTFSTKLEYAIGKLPKDARKQQPK